MPPIINPSTGKWLLGTGGLPAWSTQCCCNCCCRFLYRQTPLIGTLHWNCPISADIVIPFDLEWDEVDNYWAAYLTGQCTSPADFTMKFFCAPTPDIPGPEDATCNGDKPWLCIETATDEVCTSEVEPETYVCTETSFYAKFLFGDDPLSDASCCMLTPGDIDYVEVAWDA